MSTDDLVDTETVVVDCDLDAPPEKVWRALTQPELMAAWLAEGNINPQVGHRFELKDAAEAHRLLESRASTDKILLSPPVHLRAGQA